MQLNSCGESSRVRAGKQLPAPSASGTWLSQSQVFPLCFCDWEKLCSGLWGTKSFGTLSSWECYPDLSHPLSKLYCPDTTTTTSTAAKGPGLSVRSIYSALPSSSLRLCHLPHHGQGGWSLVSGEDRSALAVLLRLRPFGLPMSVQSHMLLYPRLLVVYSAPKERQPENTYRQL